MTQKMSLIAGLFVLAISMNVDSVRAQAKFSVQADDQFTHPQHEQTFQSFKSLANAAAQQSEEVAEEVAEEVIEEVAEATVPEGQFKPASHAEPQPTFADPVEIVRPVQEFISDRYSSDYVYNGNPTEAVETINGSIVEGQIVDEQIVEGSFAGGTFVEGQIVEGPVIDSYVHPSAVATVPAKRVHTTIGVSGLLLDRGLGRNVDFSGNGAGSILSSRNNGNDVLPGIDVNFARRRASGIGWEARYFGLFPSDETTQLGISPTTLLPGLSQLGAATTGSGPTDTVVGSSAADVFDASDNHLLIRQAELYNVEFNILRNLGPRFGAETRDVLAGVRYFEFGETLLYEAINIPEGGVGNPITADHFSTVENQLAGIQLGTRAGYRFGNRLMVHVGFKGGVYNNRVNTQQRVDYIDRATGAITNPQVAGGELSGEDFNFGSERNVKSLLGEADLSVSFQTSLRSRFRVGYRIIGITDVAFASNQIRNDFTDNALLTPAIDGDLIMQGGFFGYEFAF